MNFEAIIWFNLRSQEDNVVDQEDVYNQEDREAENETRQVSYSLGYDEYQRRLSAEVCKTVLIVVMYRFN